MRTPLGVTYNRTTKGMDYIARDLKKHLKRPYEDLLCDETLADEDEMEVDNDRFTLNHTAAKDQENGSANQGITVPVPFQRKDVGIVTVVKQQRGKFSSTPNCFTIYGEGGNLKLIDICMATDKATDQSGNGPAIDATEHLQKLVDYRSPSKKEVSSTTHSEINNINNKLTFLDHAYALPPPKGKAPAALRTQAVNKVKPVVPTKTIKAPNTTKQEIQKNEGMTLMFFVCQITPEIVLQLCEIVVSSSTVRWSGGFFDKALLQGGGWGMSPLELQRLSCP